jgi:AraC-like DNA-binding protein
MPDSITSVFSEPEDFEAALRREGCRGLLITGHGHFRARLIQIVLQRLRLTAGDEQLSRIAFIAVPVGIVVISFPVGNGALPVYGGRRMHVGEIMTLSAGEHLHARTDGVCRWGAVWIPVEVLFEYGRALTGGSFGVLPVTQRWRPSRAAGRRLRSLHAAAARMAALRPQLLADVEAAHGLEQQLIHVIIECLSGGSADTGDAMARRHQDIMVRFERLLQTQPVRQMRMNEICAALRVSAPLLRRLCIEHLGMTPTGYHRLRRLSQARYDPNPNAVQAGFS